MPTKKRDDGSGNVRLRPDGRWEVRFVLPNGQRKSVYGRTKAEAVAKHRTALREREQGRNLAVKRERLRDYLPRWLASKAGTLEPSTHRRYTTLVNGRIIPAVGRYFVDELTPQAVQAMLDDVARTGVSPLTVGYVQRVLRSALADAVKQGLVAFNAAARVTVPKQTYRKFTALDPEQAKLLLAAIEDHRDGPLIAAAIQTGARQGELLALRWADLDLDAGVMRISRSLKNVGGVLSIGTPKTTSSHRTVPLSAGAVAAFRKQRSRQAEARLACSSPWPEGDDPFAGLVFTGPDGSPLDGRNVSHRFKNVLARAGLPSVRFHDLRHSAASLMLAGGVPISTVSNVLGHSGIGITMKHYATLFPEVQAEAARALDRLLA